MAPMLSCAGARGLRAPQGFVQLLQRGAEPLGGPRRRLLQGRAGGERPATPVLAAGFWLGGQVEVQGVQQVTLDRRVGLLDEGGQAQEALPEAHQVAGLQGPVCGEVRSCQRGIGEPGRRLVTQTFGAAELRRPRAGLQTGCGRPKASHHSSEHKRRILQGVPTGQMSWHSRRKGFAGVGGSWCVGLPGTQRQIYCKTDEDPKPKGAPETTTLLDTLGSTVRGRA